MKLYFDLAIITKKGQKVEDLICPYINKFEDDLEENIKNKKEFITGFVYGDIDIDITDNQLLIKTKNGKKHYTNKAKIKDLLWNEIKENIKEQIKNEIGEEKIDLDKYFALTNSVITPDGKWHGMIPINLLQMGFDTHKEQEEYYSNYYKRFIEPYKKDGTITILKCNI